MPIIKMIDDSVFCGVEISYYCNDRFLAFAINNSYICNYFNSAIEIALLCLIIR